MSAVLAGARLVAGRLFGARALVIAALALGATLLVTLVERQAGLPGAGDRALTGVFRLVVPLAAFGLAEIATGRERLDTSSWPLARFGADGARVALGHAYALFAATALLSLLCAVVALAGARAGAPSFGGPSLPADLATTAWIAALAALAYATLFLLGSGFGRRGGGRAALLTGDFVLGGLGPFGVIFPRGSVENLIGLSAPLELSQRAASGVLALVSVTYLCVTLARVRR